MSVTPTNRISKLLPRYMLIAAFQSDNYHGEAFGLHCGDYLTEAIKFAKRLSPPDDYWEIVDTTTNNTIATSESIRRDRDGH